MWSTGINRNIVECKEESGRSDHIHSLVLIETLWNVKDGIPGTGRRNPEKFISDMDTALRSTTQTMSSAAYAWEHSLHMTL